MAKTVRIHILFIGRNGKVSDCLANLVAENPALSTDPSEQHVSVRDYLLEFFAVTNQKTALSRIRSRPPSVVMLETTTKPNSRARFLEMVRYRLPTAAILAVGRNQPPNIDSFDGFVATPVDPRKTLALVHHICHESADYQLQRGTVLLNVATRTVHTPSGRYHMTPKQCALLQMLMKRHGETVPRADIMQTIWETSYMDDTRTLDVHIRWLRERIETDPSAPIYLVTVRGVGYRLNLDVDEQG